MTSHFSQKQNDPQQPQRGDREIYQLLRYDWQQQNDENDEIYIIDEVSFWNINEALTNNYHSPIENINKCIIIDSRESNIKYFEPVLIKGLHQKSQNQKLSFRVISQEANKTIFTSLGYSGSEVRRRVVVSQRGKNIDLYPQQICFQLISARQLNLMKKREDKDTGQTKIMFPPVQKFQINYYQDQTGDSIKDKIRKIIKTECSPNITSDIRVYIYNSDLFKLWKYERILEYYYLKEDMNNVASLQQAKFYKIIENKKYDDFLAEIFPGKLMGDQQLGIILTQNSKLIVEYYSQQKWVFPNQPSFSVAKRCRECHLVGQLYLYFECDNCHNAFLFCSRVCHFQGLDSHPCKEAKQQLQIIYSREYVQLPQEVKESEVVVLDPNNLPTSEKQKQKEKEKEKVKQKQRENEKGKDDKFDLDNFLGNSKGILLPKQSVEFKDLFDTQKNQNKNSDIKRVPKKLIIKTEVKEKPNKSSQNKGRGGINNIGNSCYLNSSIQMISRTIFGQKVLALNNIQPKQHVLQAYIKLLKQMKEASPNSPVSIQKAEQFKDIIDQEINNFIGMSQHDAHQFLTFFLDKLNSQIKKQFPTFSLEHFKNNQSQQANSCYQWLQYLKHNNSVITQLFYGQLLEETKCPNCHGKSCKFAPFNCLSCSIPANFQSTSIQVYYEVYSFKSQIGIQKLTVSGTVLELLDTFKSRVVVSQDFKQNMRLFRTGYFGELKQFKLADNLNDIVSEITLSPTQNKFFVFGSQYSAAKYLIFRINDQNGQPLTFKRPFYLKSLNNHTNKDLYNQLKEYLYSVVYYRAKTENNVMLQTFLKEDVTRFFTLTLQTDGDIKTDGQVIYAQNGKKLPFNDEKLQIPSEGLTELWVILKRNKNLSSIENNFYTTVIRNINLFSTLERTGYLNIGGKGVSLIDCLKEEFNKETVLDQGNEWDCPNCEVKRRAYQRTGLYKTGKYLIIQVKRFKKGMDGIIFQKNNTKVEVPLLLDLAGLLQTPTLPQIYYKQLSQKQKITLQLPSTINEGGTSQYKLQGLILHSGTTKGGHYKALCLQNNEWWQYDDSHANQINILKKLNESVLQQKVYIMLYEKVMKDK